MKASARAMRITPKKINLIADLVRNKDAKIALEILDFIPKKGANILYSAVKSAVANAENNFKQNIDHLYVKEVVVTKAATLKRFLPASRGRTQPILKRNAHVTVIIGVREDTKPKKESAKKEEPETAKSPKKKAAKKAVTPQENTTHS